MNKKKISSACLALTCSTKNSANHENVFESIM